MSNDERDNSTITEKRKLEKKFEEMNALINMASSMQDNIIKKKREVRNLILILGVIFYMTFMILILLRFYLSVNLSMGKFNYLIVFTSAFWTAIGFFSYIRFREITQDLKIERYAMKELMEVIFNLRKTFSKYTNIDLVELTILDLKLKRLRFY